MPFLPPNQQRQSTEGTQCINSTLKAVLFVHLPSYLLAVLACSVYLLESGSDYDNPQWLDTQSSSSSTLNGADHALLLLVAVCVYARERQ